jgi:GNAT superfamily N-acetyltransferase
MNEKTIIKLVSKNQTYNQLNSYIKYYLSNWDSIVFGKKIVIIDEFQVLENKIYEGFYTAQRLLYDFHNQIQEKDIDCVIIKIKSTNSTCIRALNEFQYINYETILKLEKDIPAYNIQNYKYRFAGQKDLPKMLAIAQNCSYKLSHFYLDHRFDNFAVDRMYSKWINTAFNEENKFIVIEQEEEIAGFFIYKLEPLHKANWIYAVINEKFQNKGIGFKLFNSALDACCEDNVKTIKSSLAVKTPNH